MISKLPIIFMCSLLAFCESAFVDTLHKCTLDDASCLKGLIQNLLKDVGKDGIKEYNISGVDPAVIKNLKIPILGLVNMNIEEGEARGIRDCVIEKIESDTKERRFAMEISCDLNIKVKVKLTDISTALQKMFGSGIIEGGGGNAKVKLDKLHLKLEYFYDIVKKEDGEIYIKCKPEKKHYEYEIGDIKVVVDKFVLGESDASELINEVFQTNLPFIMKTFGKSIFDVALNLMDDIVYTFFDKTPTKYFINGDLSPSS